MTGRPSHLTKAILEELGGLVEDISDDIARRSKAKRVLVDLRKALDKGNFDATARILKNRSEHLIDVYPKSKSTLDKLRLDLNRRLETRLRETCRQLEEYCRSAYMPKASG